MCKEITLMLNKSLYLMLKMSIIYNRQQINRWKVEASQSNQKVQGIIRSSNLIHSSLTMIQQLIKRYFRIYTIQAILAHQDYFHLVASEPMRIIMSLRRARCYRNIQIFLLKIWWKICLNNPRWTLPICIRMFRNQTIIWYNVPLTSKKVSRSQERPSTIKTLHKLWGKVVLPNNSKNNQIL